jgi:hypothetical protein
MHRRRTRSCRPKYKSPTAVLPPVVVGGLAVNVCVSGQDVKAMIITQEGS